MEARRFFPASYKPVARGETLPLQSELLLQSKLLRLCCYPLSSLCSLRIHSDPHSCACHWAAGCKEQWQTAVGLQVTTPHREEQWQTDVGQQASTCGRISVLLMPQATGGSRQHLMVPAHASPALCTQPPHNQLSARSSMHPFLLRGPPFARLLFTTLACMRPFCDGDSPTHCLSLASPPSPSPPSSSPPIPSCPFPVSPPRRSSRAALLVA
ncbi:unnamed protein product [Closterium sp. Naga37s-1]|nr:unnamed protein product [Closterium sp. Naga37s-1]